MEFKTVLLVLNLSECGPTPGIIKLFFTFEEAPICMLQFDLVYFYSRGSCSHPTLLFQRTTLDFHAGVENGANKKNSPIVGI